VIAAVSAERLAEACGEDPSWGCEEVLDLTGSEALADFAAWAVDTPLRILLILIGALIVSRLVRKAIRTALTRAVNSSVHTRVAKATRRDADTRELQIQAQRGRQRTDAVASVLQSAASLVIYIIALFTILAEIGISLAPLLAGAGVAGIALGFGAQTLVRDFLAGIFILVEDQYAAGDIVDLGDAVGVVENVSLRTTRLRSVDGTVWHVPNGEVVRVGNKSQDWSRSLLDIEVAYDTDIAQAKDLIKQVADDYAATDDDIIGEPEVWGIEMLGASGIAIRLVVKTQPSEQWRINRELRERIKAAFDAVGIEIPFPQQTVWHRNPAPNAPSGEAQED